MSTPKPGVEVRSAQREYPWGPTNPGHSNQYAIRGCDFPSGTGTCPGVTSIAPVGTATLGAGRWQTFRRILMPALYPALITGFALSFARALGEYGSVVFVSGNMPFHTEIAPVLIVAKLEEFKYAEATAIAVVLLTASFAMLIAINLLERWSKADR